jgi:hypothetical protein
MAGALLARIHPETAGFSVPLRAGAEYYSRADLAISPRGEPAVERFDATVPNSARVRDY